MIENASESDLFLNKVHAEYLLSATEHLSRISSNALRCHWNILLGDLMEIKNFAFSKRKEDEKICCMYCLTPWRIGTFSLRVIPKAKRGKKMRILARKLERQKELSKVQKKLAKAMHTGPVVVVNCKICSKSTKFKIPQDLQSKHTRKGKEKISKDEIQVEETEKLETKKQRKRKRKQKNQFSGLNPSLMTQIHGTKVKQNASHDGNKVDKLQRNSIAKNVHNKDDNNKKSRKRKMENCLVTDILDQDSGKLIKLKKKDVEMNSPLIAPHAIANKKGNNKCNDFKKTVCDKKKRNLSMWKRLIAREESKQTKNSSLQDFLSAL